MNNLVFRPAKAAMQMIAEAGIFSGKRALCTEHTFNTLIKRHCFIQCPAECLKHRLNHMMCITAVKHFDVKVHSCTVA